MLSILLLAAIAAPPEAASPAPPVQIQPGASGLNELMVIRCLESYTADFKRMPACVRDAEKKPKYSFFVNMLKTYPQGSPERILGQDIIECGEPWYSPKILALAAKMPVELKGPAADEGCHDPLFSMWQGIYGDYAADTPLGRKAEYDHMDYPAVVPVDYKRFLKLHEKEDAELAKEIPAVARLVKEGKQWPWVRPGGVPIDALLALRTAEDWELIRKISAKKRTVLSNYGGWMEVGPDHTTVFKFPDKGGP